MQPKSTVLLKVLLNKFHPGPPLPFLKALPQDTAKEIAAIDTSSSDLSAALNWPSNAIENTHYSWLAPVIAKMPAALQTQVVGSLKKKQADGICRILKIHNLPTVPTAAQRFFINKLYLEWNPQDSLPCEYLPKSSLEVLLTFEKAHIVNIIDLLAMYDLSDAIRHIVDKNKLKNIYQCLSTQKQQFLRLCLHKKEKLAAQKLDINKWDGHAESLNNILHRRGMARLGKALCGQSKQFLWHITHRLDVGRGQNILEHYTPNEIPGITPLLVQQLFSVINFLTPKSEP